MDEASVFLLVLVVIILALAVFSYQGAAVGIPPYANPPNPNAEFGVIHDRRTGSGGSGRVEPYVNPPPPPPPPVLLERLETLRKNFKVSISGAKSRDVKGEYVDIIYSGDERLNISGWRIGNSRGAGFQLGHTTNLPGLTPIGNQDQLVATKGARIHVVTARSPIGSNFRANKCVAYFTQFNAFRPSLPGPCPSPSREPGVDALSDKCFSYVRGNLNSCKTPLSLPFDLGNECRDFISRVATYDYCITNHRYDTDFYKNEWWTYLNREDPLWSDIRDVITLTDESGNVITTTSY